MKLFLEAGPVKFLTLNILGSLQTSTKKTQLILVIPDMFSKLTQTVPLRAVTALTSASAFLKGGSSITGFPPLLLPTVANI